jgi:hypothetical protein
MAFSGAWKMTAMVQPDQAVTHVADPAHALVGPDDGVQVATYTAPQLLDPGVIGEFPGMEFVVTTGGRVVDTTDYDSHERDDGDHGAATAGVFYEEATRFSDERRSAPRFEGGTAVPTSVVALQRGRNGLPENNPGGFRLGWIEQWWENRKFPIGERVHDHRIIFPDLPQEDQGAPAVPAGAYPTSFASLARNITNVMQTPTARREPPPLYGDLPTDGAPAYPSVVGDIGVVG